MYSIILFYFLIFFPIDISPFFHFTRCFINTRILFPFHKMIRFYLNMFHLQTSLPLSTDLQVPSHSPVNDFLFFHFPSIRFTFFSPTPFLAQPGVYSCEHKLASPLPPPFLPPSRRIIISVNGSTLASRLPVMVIRISKTP